MKSGFSVLFFATLWYKNGKELDKKSNQQNDAISITNFSYIYIYMKHTNMSHEKKGNSFTLKIPKLMSRRHILYDKQPKNLKIQKCLLI